MINHEVDIWRPEACCNMVWEAGRLDDVEAESMEEIEHRGQHRLCKMTRTEIHKRCQCVIKWSLKSMEVTVRCY